MDQPSWASISFSKGSTCWFIWPMVRFSISIDTILPNIVFMVFLSLPLVGGLHFDSRQIFSPGPPLDSSAARFRSCPARWAGSSREDCIGAEELCYTNSRLPSRRLAKSRLLNCTGEYKGIIWLAQRPCRKQQQIAGHTQMAKYTYTQTCRPCSREVM